MTRSSGPSRKSSKPSRGTGDERRARGSVAVGAGRLMRQLILDTETTGLDARQGHRIIEIGCVELIDRRPTGRHLHVYVNPEREIDAGATEVHGFTWDMLRDKPRFADIAQEFGEFVRGAQWIIHNA